MGALFVIAGLGFLAEKTRIGAVLTGAVVAIFLAIFLSNLPVPLPGGDGVSWGTLIPQSGGHAQNPVRDGPHDRGIPAGSLATVMGAVIAFSLFDLGDLEASLAGLFTATYIGGSVNYAALADITGLAANEPSLVSAATAVDNLFSGVFLAFLAILPGLHFIASRFVQKDHSQGAVADDEKGRATALTLTITLAYALVLVAIADFLTGQLAALLGAFGVEDATRAAGNWRYGILTVITLIPATFLSKQMAKLHGGYELGAPQLLALVTVVLGVHALVLFGLGSLLRFSLPELITASNAAVLGATTAPALAAAKGGKELITPGVLVGVLGYVIGTLIATA
ncbi:Uncharacterized membrane protein YjcL, partial [Durusdinium trenchii]